jgi:hypothetical protein
VRRGQQPEHQWALVLSKRCVGGALRAALGIDGDSVLAGGCAGRNGAYHCACCHASGSWFDFRQHVHGHAHAVGDDAGAALSRPATEVVRRAQQQLAQSPVLAALLDRGLKRPTLDHFGVGAVLAPTAVGAG